MTPRERVLSSLEHKEPDTVLRMPGFMPGLANKLSKHFKMTSVFLILMGSGHSKELTLWGTVYIQEALSFGITKEVKK